LYENGISWQEVFFQPKQMFDWSEVVCCECILVNSAQGGVLQLPEEYQVCHAGAFSEIPGESGGFVGWEG